MLYRHRPETILSNAFYLTSKDSQIYYTRVSTYLMQIDRQNDTGQIYKSFFDGPLESHAALFFMAGSLGLIPLKDNMGLNGAPILYALNGRPEGAVKQPQDPQIFIELVAMMLTHKKTLKYLTNSLVEFHDFLKAVDAPQADRFMADVAEALFQRTGNLTALLACPGDSEDIGRSAGYGDTLKTVLVAQGRYEASISALKPREVTSALLRFRWEELLVNAPKRGRDEAFSQDLGL